MIISHKHKFIFIKTSKTAGTSIETYLEPHCGDEDIITPVYPPIDGHKPRNFNGRFNPVPEIIATNGSKLKVTVRDFIRRQRYYNHLPAILIQARTSATIWNNYFKFCIERNPWDKTLSHYHMVNSRAGNTMTIDQYFDQANPCLNYPKYTNRRGEIIVDRVIKYEQLNEGLTEVLGELSIPFSGELGVKAKADYRTDRRSYRDVLTPEQRDTISRIFKAEIQFHGYTF